jgi:ABC-type glutathione transport system ATPase component
MAVDLVKNEAIAGGVHPRKEGALDVAVRIRDLFKHFGSGEQRVQALRGIDWDVYAGQMTLIVGPSG